MNSPYYAIIGSREERNRFAILQLQHYLRELTDPNLLKSGSMDERTALALLTFQRQNGLSPTGKADIGTWRAVVLAGEEAIMAKSDPLPLYLPPLSLFGGMLSPGDTGDAVSLIQILLNRFLLTLKESDPLAVDGHFGAETAAAVEEFRRIHGLHGGNTVDKAVWNLLAASFSVPPSYE